MQKGEQVTLTGRTGAGKSTIFKLLLGLYRPQQGKVMLNGVEAATLPDTARRPLVGYVEQSFRRVPGTIRHQITLFDAAITPQQAEDAARTVGLHDAIAALPEGYDTPCTPGIFSQGQWQLLSIARAIAPGRKSCCWMKLPQTWTPEQNRLFWMLCSAPVRTAPWFPSATGCTTAPAGEALRSDTDHFKHRKKSNF